MARWTGFLIARLYSQVIPRVCYCAGRVQRSRNRTDRDRLEGEQLSSELIHFDREPKARQRLPARNVAQLKRKAFEWRQAAGLHVQMRNLKAPAVQLTAGMLAHDAIKPSLQAARQREICAVDRQHERIIQHGGIEPI